MEKSEKYGASKSVGVLKAKLNPKFPTRKLPRVFIIVNLSPAIITTLYSKCVAR